MGLVQSELGGRLGNDNQIDHWPACFATNGQTCIAKQVHEPGNALGKPDNLFQDLGGEWGGRAPDDRRMQLVGPVRAHLAPGVEPARAAAGNSLADGWSFRLAELPA